MEEKNLEDLVRRWQDNRDFAARNEAVLAMRGYVRYIARKFNSRRMERKDFVQEGFIAVLSATDSYRHDTGTSFRTYASRAAYGQMSTALRTNIHVVSVSKHKIQDVDIEECGDTFFEDIYVDDSAAFENLILSDRKRFIETHINPLDETDRGIIEGRMTINDLVKDRGVTKQGAYWIRDRAFRRVKKSIATSGESIYDYL